jgi:hydrogenase expression/formation protein HypC
MCLAVLGCVATVDGEHAVVDVDGRHRRVSLALLMLERQQVTIGDWVLVHTGIAVSVLDPDDAAEALRLRRRLMNDRGGSSP